MSSPFEQFSERWRDRRSDRRVPVRCPATIWVPNRGVSFDATCLDLSASGMSLHCNYVPRYGEQLDVSVWTPDIAGQPAKPLHVRVEVAHCMEVKRGSVYELGVRTLNVLAAP